MHHGFLLLQPVGFPSEAPPPYSQPGVPYPKGYSGPPQTTVHTGQSGVHSQKVTAQTKLHTVYNYRA